MTRCIYKIINVINNKFYVGSAVDFEKRKARHLWRLRRGDHANKHLQAAWQKYGEKAFVFAVIQTVAEHEDLLAMEDNSPTTK
jgi:group I intron endonuclease